MTFRTLVLRGLRHFWPTHVPVVLGVAAAVSVLAGALLVGESVRASLRRLALARLGGVEAVAFASPVFREALANDTSRAAGGAQPPLDVAPVLLLQSVAEHQGSGRRASGVAVYGVDERFFALHQDGPAVRPPARREALLSAALARELGAGAGDGVVFTFQALSAVPADTLQGRRDDAARSMRVVAREVLPEDQGLGEFAIRPSQGLVRAAFVPLELVQQTIEAPGTVNALLASRPGLTGPAAAVATSTSDALGDAIARTATLDDFGLRVRPAPRSSAAIVESASGFLSPPVEQAVQRAATEQGLSATPVLTYVANEVRIGNRTVPYSVVTAANLSAPWQSVPDGIGTAHDPIWLNDWAMDALSASGGDRVTLEYYLWSDEQGLETRTAEFVVAGSVPMDAEGGDATFTPEYPGLTDELHISAWDPPFPVDLSQVRPRDEDYWTRYRAAPKAFVTLEAGRRLWASRYGRTTSVRLERPATDTGPPVLPTAFASRLRASLDPVALGAVSVVPVREDALRASEGTTDFGEYFVYFSFFLVVSGLLLAGLFFRLGIEQRLREVGLLRAVGIDHATVRRLFLAEGMVLAAVGAVLGVAGALGYSWLVLLALRTWWVDAVGTTRLAWDPGWRPLAAGAAGGLFVSALAIAFTLRGLASASPRRLLTGDVALAREDAATAPARGRRHALAAAALAVAGVAAVIAGAFELVGRVPAFFGAGTLLLLASLFGVSARLRRPPSVTIGAGGSWPLARLGARGASHRPGRAVSSVALVALAAFTIVSVGSFRRGAPADPSDRGSGTGGYALIGESVLPVYHDPGSARGRAALALGTADDAAFEGVSIDRFRLRAGDDASCLTLYRPTRPRLIGATATFVEQGRFAFGASLAGSDDERRNPWRLLSRTFADGAVPAIGDANSLRYVFHVDVGEDVEIPREGADPLRLRIVAALVDSVFQSELVIAEERFTALFPGEEGFRVFLVDVGGRDPVAVETALERTLADQGLDVASTADRLATYHRVENTYLTTFQMLGALGLLLGTIGIGVVLFRNVLERRRELALLRAVGFGGGAIAWLVVAEAALVVGLGALVGTASALLAVAPAIAERRDAVPAGPIVLLVAAVVVAGVGGSVVAARAARRFSLVTSLRTE